MVTPPTGDRPISLRMLQMYNVTWKLAKMVDGAIQNKCICSVSSLFIMPEVQQMESEMHSVEELQCMANTLLLECNRVVSLPWGTSPALFGELVRSTAERLRRVPRILEFRRQS